MGDKHSHVAELSRHRERAAALLGELSAHETNCEDIGDVCDVALTTLATLLPDAEVVALRLSDAANAPATLVAATKPMPRCFHDDASGGPSFGTHEQTHRLVSAHGEVGTLHVEWNHAAPRQLDALPFFSASIGPMLERVRGGPRPMALLEYIADVLAKLEVPLLLLDETGTLVISSRGFEDLFQSQPSPGTSLEALVDAEGFSGKRLQTRPQVWDGRLISANQRHVSITSVPVDSPALHARGWILILQDTEQLKELEHQIAHAEKLATIGQLAAGVVHELNNPLTSIAVYSEHMREAALAENRPKAELARIERIVESTDRIRRFTQSLVAYARPASGPPRPVQIEGLIDEALGFCEHVIRQADAMARVQIEEGTPPVLGVRTSLHQVLINLITNACHAMPAGAGQLRIRARGIGDRVEIRVEDNGVGISSEQQARVFEPFYTTKGEGRGTGLGLGIVRNIVEKHGGAIHVESQLGLGATFVVTLPSS